MKTVSHREMRNNSGEILRLVAAGETVRVTNNGKVVADIVYPSTDVLVELEALGQVRPATAPISALLEIEPVTSDVTTAEILADVRGPW